MRHFIKCLIVCLGFVFLASVLQAQQLQHEIYTLGHFFKPIYVRNSKVKTCQVYYNFDFKNKTKEKEVLEKKNELIEEFEFDSLGRIIKEIFYPTWNFNSDPPYTVVEFTYDSNETLIRKDFKFNKGEFSWSDFSILYYYENGRLIACETVVIGKPDSEGNHGTKYIYDDQGRLAFFSDTARSIFKLYRYDDVYQYEHETSFIHFDIEQIRKISTALDLEPFQFIFEATHHKKYKDGLLVEESADYHHLYYHEDGRFDKSDRFFELYLTKAYYDKTKMINRIEIENKSDDPSKSSYVFKYTYY
jgi:hypothetical protein